MVKLSDTGSLVPPAEAIPSATPKQSPVLTKEQILKSLSMRKPGPRQGKAFVGKGGLKPYRRPADGTKPNLLNNRTRKPLRALKSQSEK